MIDKTKQYKTRYGLPVEIYATDRGGDYSVHGAVFRGGCWVQYSWTSEGKHMTAGSCSYDLIEVKPRIQMTMWVNVYHDMVSSGYKTLEQAELYRGHNCIACIQIEIDCEEGEGL